MKKSRLCSKMFRPPAVLYPRYVHKDNICAVAAFFQMQYMCGRSHDGIHVRRILDIRNLLAVSPCKQNDTVALPHFAMSVNRGPNISDLATRLKVIRLKR